MPRSIYEGARDMARQIARSWEGRTSRRLRKKIEMLFAHLKRIRKRVLQQIPPIAGAVFLVSLGPLTDMSAIAKQTSASITTVRARACTQKGCSDLLFLTARA